MGTIIEVIEILEIELEEMDLFLYFFKDYFIVVVILSLGEESSEEEFV